ncbi:MAG: response regulator transcription factor [Hymenobacter sp.]|nr:MAG: response regulator transcription factor [Hymenobacter sp.]
MPFFTSIFMLYRRVLLAPTFARMITLGIIEDQAAFREALCTYLGAQPEFTCVLCAASHEAFVAGLAGLAQLPTLVLSGIGLPGHSGTEGLAMLRAVLPGAEVLLLSVHTDAGRVFEALRQGAVGYLEKTTPLPLLKEHLLQVAAGGSPMSPSVARHVARYFQLRAVAVRPSLTPRESDIVRGIEDGLSHKLIAARLGVRAPRHGAQPHPADIP